MAGTLCHQHVHRFTAEELENFLSLDFVAHNASKAKVENHKVSWA